MGPQTFDDILSLEEQFYDGGFQQGLSDGIKAGRTEGRTFGLEKGFERYTEAGRYHGRALVWENRLSNNIIGQTSRATPLRTLPSATSSSRVHLPFVPENPRFFKHLKVLHAVSELESLPKENTEEAVSDFEDRTRRAQAKVKILEKLSGEVRGGHDGAAVSPSRFAPNEMKQAA